MALARIAGVSSINGMTGDVTLAVTTPDTVTIYAGDHGTLDPTGAADQAPILRACYTAALAALASGAKATDIVWPAGTFKMSTPGTGYSTAGGTALVLRSVAGGHTGQVRLRGQGVSSTVFKMTTTCACLVSSINTESDTFGNIVLEQFTVDHNNINVSGRPTALLSIYYGAGINIDRVTVQDVNVVNMHTPNGNTVVSGIVLDPGASVWNAATQYTCKNIFIRRCKLLGGCYGIQIQAYNSTVGTSAQRDADILAGGNVSNAFFDNVIIENFEWDSQANFATNPGAYDSAGVMIGQSGVFGKLRLTDCTVKGSYDVGYEIDSVYDCVLTRCYAEDSFTSNFYYRHQGGLPEFDAPTGMTPTEPAYERSNFVMVDCMARNKKMASTTQGPTPSGGAGRSTGFTMHAFDYGIPSGHVTIRNFKHIVDGPRTFYGTGHLNQISGGFLSVDIDGMKVSEVNFTHDQNFGVFTGSLFVSLPQGRGSLRIRDLEYTVDGKNTSGQGIGIAALALSNFADYYLDIEGVYTRVNVVNSGAGSSMNFTEVVLGYNFNGADTFIATNNFTQGWRNDLTGSGQSLADFTVSSGALSVASPGSKEYRLTQVKNESQTAYGGGLVGPTTDSNITVACAKPTTPTSAYKHGVRLKVNPKTGADSIHCYVDYTGTNYRIRIDTEVGGVLTNRATTTIGTSVASVFYVRGKLIGNVVTAEYLATAPSAAYAPTATASSTFTVNTGDSTIYSFGPQAPQGYPGLVWKPVDSGSLTADFRIYYSSVVSGRIARVVPTSILGTGTVAAMALGNADASAQMRIRDVLELSEWDMAGYTLTGTSLVNITDPLFTQNMRATHWSGVGWSGSAVTVTGSPFTYTNTDWYDKDIAIYGGTVSAISVTRRGGTASQVADSTGRIIRIAPGEAVTVTYSVAPTMRSTPVT